MKDKLITQLRDIWDELNYGVRWCCLRPSPGVRLTAIVLLIVLSGIVHIWFVVRSVYQAGKNDARKESTTTAAAGEPLQRKNDSLNSLKHKAYEYKQSNK